MIAKKINLLIPMSGQGVRYQKAGYNLPKPAIPVNGTPMIERLLGCFPQSWKTSFVLPKNHEITILPGLLKRVRPEAKISYIEPHKSGPAFAILEALKSIPDEEAVLVSYCDYGMNWDAQQFSWFVESTNCDACILSYRGFHAHYLSQVNYAFSRLQGERVVEVREKGNFTSNREDEFASCGAYYFRTATLLREAIDYQIATNLQVNDEFYTSLTVQALIQKDPSAQIRIFEIPAFFQWGTPDDLKNFEYWERTYSHLNRIKSSKPQVKQVLMPMAGLGSRFSELTIRKKPMIEIQGRAMFLRALDCLPTAEATAIVTTQDVAEFLQPTKLPKNSRIKALPETPQGQALTVELGLELLDPNEEVLVTACDHGLRINSDRWSQLHKLDFDAAIFTIQGFPEVSRRPTAYSYVECEPQEPSGINKLDFPVFKKVSLKSPISADPRNDLLLVGTFWFKSTSILKAGIKELKLNGPKANNELYLDSIFDVLKNQGFKVAVFPLDAYVNWGDPNSLKEALYWQEIFLGHHLEPRKTFPGVSF